MRLKNFLIVVKDLEKAKQFYQEVFGLYKILEQDGNAILMGGLVLQEEVVWREALGKDVISSHNASVLYFEEKDIEGFVKKLEERYPAIQYVNPLTTFEWGQKMVRFYDPDGNLIEVRTPM